MAPRFFRRPSDELARALLGKVVVHRQGPEVRSGMIVETEAYLGPHDLASHARFGPTDRNRVMFGPGGISYVYLCYGIHHMFNVVSGRDGEPGAVLIRALQPGPGLGDDVAVARGPGKLARALGLTREHNGVDLSVAGNLYITAGEAILAERVAVGPRVGIDYAGEWADAPLRYWIAGHPAVSRPAGVRGAARGRKARS